MFTIIAWIIIGLIAGAIARAILPGRQGGGWLGALVCGVIGALLGGWIGSALFGGGVDKFFSLSSWLLAIGGALIMALVGGWRMFELRRQLRKQAQQV